MATTYHTALTKQKNELVLSGLNTLNFLNEINSFTPYPNYSKEQGDVIRTLSSNVAYSFPKVDRTSCLGSFILFNNNPTKKVTVTKIHSYVNDIPTTQGYFGMTTNVDFGFYLYTSTLTTGVNITDSIVPLDSANSVPSGVTVYMNNDGAAVGSIVNKTICMNVNTYGAGTITKIGKLAQGVKSKNITTQPYTLNNGQSFIFRRINTASGFINLGGFTMEIVLSIGSNQYILNVPFYLLHDFNNLFSINNTSGGSIVIKIMSITYRTPELENISGSNFISSLCNQFIVTKIKSYKNIRDSVDNIGDTVPADIVTGMYGRVEFAVKEDFHGSYGIVAKPNINLATKVLYSHQTLKKDIILNYGEGVSLINTIGFANSSNQHIGAYTNFSEQLYTVNYKVEDVPSTGSTEYAYSSVQ